MGGGPLEVDVVRSTCLLTFPEDSQLDPVTVDVRYLYAIGLRFVRHVIRERLGQSEGKYGLLMQRKEQQGGESLRTRFLAISSDQLLRDFLKETFPTPDKEVTLHLISLENVADLSAVYVRPQRNPRFSPEPVQALDMVLPVLSIHNEQGVAQVIPRMERISSADREASQSSDSTQANASAEDSSSYKKAGSSSTSSTVNNHTISGSPRAIANVCGVQNDLKDGVKDDVNINGAIRSNPTVIGHKPVVGEQTQEQNKIQSKLPSTIQLSRVIDTTSTTITTSNAIAKESTPAMNVNTNTKVESWVLRPKAMKSKPPKSTASSTRDSLTSNGSTCSSSLLLDSPSRSAPASPIASSDAGSCSSSARSSFSSPPSPVSPRSVLSSSMPLSAASEPTFFISSSWHLQAEEMSASLRLHQERKSVNHKQQHRRQLHQAPRESHHQQRYRPHSAATPQRSTRTSLGDSFVFLEKWWKASS